MRHRFFLTIFLISLVLSYIYTLTPKKEAPIGEESSIGLIYKSSWNKEGDLIFVSDSFKALVKVNFDDESLMYTLSKGATVKVNTSFFLPRRATNPGEFDYRKYLLGKGVAYQAYVDKKDIEIIEDNPNAVKAYGASLRANVSRTLKKYLSKEKSTLVMAIMTGDAGGLDGPIKDNIQLSGLSHLMAVSGTHVIMFLMPFKKAFKNKYMNVWVRNILLVFPLLFFLIVTDMTPSVFRSVMSYIFGIIAFLLGRKRDSLNILGLVGFLQILRNPYSIYDIGFILSYSCVFSICLIQPALVRFFVKKGYKPNKTGGGSGKGDGGYEKSKVLQISSNTLITGLSVNIGIIPIMINMFNRINVVGVIFTCIASPIASVILISGYVMWLFDFLNLRFIALFISYIITTVTYLLDRIVYLSRYLPPFLTDLVVPSKGMVLYILYYLFIGYFILSNSKRKITINKIYKIRGTLAVMSVVFILLYPSSEIIFYDVGQGNCIYVESKNGIRGLIDGGEGYLDVSNLLLKRGIKDLDFVIVSHGHSDHYGGIYDVVDTIKVKYMFVPNNVFDEEVIRIAKYAKRKGIEVVYVSERTVYEADRQFLVDILFNKDITSLNNSSLVVKLKIEQVNLLICSDIEKEAEEYYVRTDKIDNCDIIQAAHHGSDTSSTLEFINKAEPEIAVFCVGRNNKYGHPSKEVLDRFSNCEIYRTDLNGAVIIKVKGRSIRIRKYL